MWAGRSDNGNLAGWVRFAAVRAAWCALVAAGQPFDVALEATFGRGGVTALEPGYAPTPPAWEAAERCAAILRAAL
jgi:hypothetical protein